MTVQVESHCQVCDFKQCREATVDMVVCSRRVDRRMVHKKMSGANNHFVENLQALEVLGCFDDDAQAEGSEDESVLLRIPVERTETDIFIRTALLKNITVRNGGQGLKLYDPYFYNTAITKSRVTRSDSINSKLYLRGYDMETLVEHSDFLEVAYLLIYGQGLPSKKRAHEWRSLVLTHTYLHEDILEQLRTFRYDAHPMGMLISAFAALSTFHPEANPSLQGSDLYAEHEAARNKQIFRMLGKIMTIAACAYRLRIGRPFNKPLPADSATYTENFLAMVDKLAEPCYRPHSKLARLLDQLFIALIDDGMNSAAGMLRHVASTKVDPYTAIASALAAHYGARISGVGDAVLAMLSDIGSPDAVPAYVENAKSKGIRLQGFGHLNYKCYDPRCRVVKKITHAVAEIMGADDLLSIAVALEEYVANDDYYTCRRVFPNVDLYLPVCVRMMGFPPDFFCVIVSIPRVAGLIAHWHECQFDMTARIARPRQLYEGPPARDYINIEDRKLELQEGEILLGAKQSQLNRRRRLGTASTA